MLASEKRQPMNESKEREQIKRQRWKHLVVLPYDTLLRMRVSSESRPEIEHIVDLGGYRGNGECSCEHFEFRLRPQIEEKPGGKPKRCLHIEAARSALVDLVIGKLTNPHHYES